MMPTAGHYMAPVIARFQQLHPGVELHVQEQGARAQRQLLLDGKLDMALGLHGAGEAGGAPAGGGPGERTPPPPKTRGGFAPPDGADPGAPVPPGRPAPRAPSFPTPYLAP